MQQFKKRYSIYLVFVGLIIFTQGLSARSLPDFTPLIEKNSAAVVNISTTLKPGSRMGRHYNIPDIPGNSPFSDFFKKYFGQIPEGRQPFQERSSLGSGFIISKDGYIITNNHVVKDADEIIVRLHDRREFNAEIIGRDERSDIALLKIAGEELPNLKLGDSSTLQVGEWVLAIGSPFGFDYSVTQGIISAMGRSLPNENYVPFIQTDVAINPGNSGGPLFNLKGEVIGVNSQIYSRTGGYMGLSFAVPINVVTNVYHQLRDQGHVSRGWLGVLIQDITRELAESFGMDKPHGALVAKVLPNSPAESAGLEIGDVVTRFDGNEVSFSSDLPPMVGSTNVGDSVPVVIIRRGKKSTIKIVIAKLPEDNELTLAVGKSGVSRSNPLNIVVQDLTEEERKKLDLEGHGIIVKDVTPGAAGDAGIRTGDIILLMNNEKVGDVNHFQKLVNDLPQGKSIPVLIQRRGGPIFLALKLSESEDS